MAALNLRQIKSLGDFLVFQLALAFSRKGHNLTGAFIKSLEAKVRITANGFGLDFLALEYGRILNDGVPPNRVPYSPGSGAKSSAFIAGLIRYAQRRMGLRGKEAVSAAHAIARKRKRIGFPASNWLDELLTAEESRIEELIQQFVEEELTTLVVSYINSKTKTAA